MEKLKIMDLALEDRPREKLLTRGVSALSDAELIAILIGSGSPNETAIHLSQRILNSVQNNLHELAKVSVKDLRNSFYGIGDAKALSIIAALELGKRRNSSDFLQRKVITCSHDAWMLFFPDMADIGHEEMWAAYVNVGSKVLHKARISQGGMSSTTADMRIIFKQALDVFATGIILCHNHPSGNVKPSREDDELTRRLKEAGRIMQISLLDHIVLSNEGYYSYGDEGRIL